jgi:molecular chaperone HscA
MLKASMEFAKEDIDSRMLKEQQVEAKRVIEAVDSALASDGDSLLGEAELNNILLHRNNLEQQIELSPSDNLKQLIKAVEVASENYVAKRMNSSVVNALAGKQVDEVNL